ncbi:lectin BRA-2 [Patella vulgata]|uniref:lectin BRA-2 n=1 Tax=Patella vulgata TaxID=6465 RepID=UPI00217F3002|nr:lectin BRA-2 [Patella vulgata]
MAQFWNGHHTNVSVFMLLLLLCLNLPIDSSSNSCSVDLHGCDYSVSVTPKSKCKPTDFHDIVDVKRYRIKRSETSEDDNAPITKAEFKKLSKKVSKTVDKLSVRVLRWWRKLARKMDELHNKGPKERSLADTNHNCPERFIGIKDWTSCYLLSNFNTSWYDAKDYCGAFEGDLVSMGTVKEHFLLTFLIKNDPDLRKANGWWTSGSYFSNRKQWIWTSNNYNKQFTFIKWGEGEPNEEASQCMLLKKDDDHKWHDEICTKRYNFICEVQTTNHVSNLMTT